MHGGIIGALLVLVLVLLIGGGAFLFLSSRNSADAVATGTVLAQTQVAFAVQNTQSAASTLTATNFVTATHTSTATSSPTATSTSTPISIPTSIPTTVVPPTLVSIATSAAQLPPTAAPVSVTTAPTAVIVAATITCDGFNKPTRLNVGMAGRVLPDQNNLVNSKPARPSIDPSSQNLGTIPAGGQFKIVDGPVCAESIIWWLVTYRDLRGWTGEGEGVNYWVEPATGQ